METKQQAAERVYGCVKVMLGGMPREDLEAFALSFYMEAMAQDGNEVCLAVWEHHDAMTKGKPDKGLDFMQELVRLSKAATKPLPVQL